MANDRDEQIAERDPQLRWTLSRFCSIAWFHLAFLSTHDQVDSGEDPLHLPLGNSPHSLDELSLIDGHELRHIGHGITIEPRVLCYQQHVAWGYRPPEVAREDNTDNCGDLAAIERI